MYSYNYYVSGTFPTVEGTGVTRIDIRPILIPISMSRVHVCMGGGGGERWQSRGRLDPKLYSLSPAQLVYDI